MALTKITASVDARNKAAPDPFFLDENLAYVKKSVAELHAGKGTAYELLEVDES